MDFFWFFAFLCAITYVFAQKSRMSDLRKKGRADLATGAELMAKAFTIMEKAEQLKSQAVLDVKQAEKSVGEVQEQNKVHQSAIEEIVNLWINDSWKSISEKLSATNFSTQKTRMEKVFETCRKLGIEFDGRQEQAFYVRLQTEWKREVALEKAKEEQNRIKEIMREEQRAEKVKVAELKRLEQEKKELEKKHEEHLERIKMLQEMESLKKLTEEQKRELEEALSENKDLELEIAEKERRKAMAELTKAGNVYVISNLGAFGEKIFKVGMTRRLIPEERIKELGDASVPFPFDCHMMIPSENAPALESKLHEKLWEHRLNLVNDGKEFFKTELSTIKEIVDKHSGTEKYRYIEFPPAEQWRESEARRKQKNFGEYDSVHEKSDESDEAA